MQILENLQNIGRILEKYERLHEVGLLTEVSADDISGLDSSLADLDKQVDSLQGSLDVYIKIFDGLGGDQGGNNTDAKAAASKCSDTLTKVRAQLDDIAQLDMGKVNAIGDFFGKDSSFKSAMEELAVISEEMGKIHSIAAGAAAAIARLSKRGEGEAMDSDNLKDKGLMDATGFFKKSKVEFKDVLKQVERSAKDNLPGVMGKLGGFFKGMVKGAKAKPLFGLSAEDITMAIANAKGSAFNPMGEKIVSLGNDISKFGESMAKYKSKEKELQKAARKEKKEMEKTAKQAAAMAATNIVGREETMTFGDRIKAAKAVVSDEQKDSVEASMVALSDEFSKLKAENKRYSMDFLLEQEGSEENNEESDDSGASGDEQFYDDLEDKIVDELIDTVDGIETSDAEKIADKMLESKKIVTHDKNFYRMQKLAGIKR